MNCKFLLNGNYCSLSTMIRTTFCIDNSRDDIICDIHKEYSRLRELELQHLELQKKFDKELEIKSSIFNTLFSSNEVFIEKKNGKWLINLSINNMICSWEVSEEEIKSGAYQAIPIRGKERPERIETNEVLYDQLRCNSEGTAESSEKL